jgi:hypothetical protein
VASREEEVRIRRVIACFAPGYGGRPELVARLAQELEAELLGLFIEDVELLRFASLPFAREIGIASAQARSMDVASLERQLRGQARALEQALAAILGPGPAGWSLRVERSSPLVAIEAALAQVLEPALLIPPGGRLAGERRRVKKKELTKEALKQWLAAGRPVVVLPE